MLSEYRRKIINIHHCLLDLEALGALGALEALGALGVAHTYGQKEEWAEEKS